MNWKRGGARLAPQCLHGDLSHAELLAKIRPRRRDLRVESSTDLRHN